MVMGMDMDTGTDMVTTMNQKKSRNIMSRAGCQHWQAALVGTRTFRQGTEPHSDFNH